MVVDRGGHSVSTVEVRVASVNRSASACASVVALRAVSASVVSSSGSAARRSSQRAVSFAAWVVTGL